MKNSCHCCIVSLFPSKKSTKLESMMMLWPQLEDLPEVYDLRICSLSAGGRAAIFLMQTDILTMMDEGGNKTMQKSKLVRLMRWWKSGTQ